MSCSQRDQAPRRRQPSPKQRGARRDDQGQKVMKPKGPPHPARSRASTSAFRLSRKGWTSELNDTVGILWDRRDVSEDQVVRRTIIVAGVLVTPPLPGSDLPHPAGFGARPAEAANSRFGAKRLRPTSRRASLSGSLRNAFRLWSLRPWRREPGMVAIWLLLRWEPARADQDAVVLLRAGGHAAMTCGPHLRRPAIDV